MNRRQKGSGRAGKRAWRIVRIGLRALGLFSIGVVVLAIVALRFAAVRGLVVKQIDDALRPAFAGNVSIESIDRIGPTGVDGVHVRVADSSGIQVLRVDGASIRISLVSTVRSFLFGKGDQVIDLADVKLGYVDANLDADDSGKLRLATAFEPKEPKKPSEPSGRKTAIHLRRVAMNHAWLHGRPSGSQIVDADVDDLLASASIGSEQAVDLVKMAVTTRAMPQNANPRLVIAASFAAPAKNGNDKQGHVDVHGDIGGIPLTARASIDGSDVEGVVDVPQVTPDMVARLAPSARTSEELSMHAELRGRLPDLEASVHVTPGRGTIDVRAHATLSDEKTVHATLVARNIDAAALSVSAPKSDLGADAAVDIKSHPNGDAEGTYTFDLLPGTAGGTAVPSAHFSGRIVATGEGERKTMSFTSAGVVDERGARTSIDVNARQAGDVTTVGFGLTASAPHLEQTRLGTNVRGSVELGVRGTLVAAEAKSVDVAVNLQASNMSEGDRRVRRAWLRAHVRGNMDDPLVDAIFQATRLDAGTTRFATAAVTAHGSLRRSDVTIALAPIDAPKINGHATIETGGATTVRDASISFARDDLRAVIGVRALRAGGGELRVDGVTIEGLGDPIRAEARKTDGALVVRASTNELDLSRVARLFRLAEVKDGNVAFDVDLDVRRAEARGHVRLDLWQGQFDRLRSGNGHFEATFDGRAVDGVLHAQLGEVGNVDIDKCHVEIGGRGALDASSWKKAWGTLALDSDIDLAKIRRLLPKGSVPLTDLAGRLQLKGEVKRASAAEEVPEVRLSAKTRGLVMSGRGDAERVNGARVLATPPWSIEGVDAELAASVAADSGATELKVRVFDRKGGLISLDARSPSVPYRDWMHQKSLPVERLLAMRVAGRLAVPRRELKTLPALLKTQQFSGDVAADVDIDGALADPDVKLSLETAKFASAIGAGTKPLDAKITGRYLQDEAKITLNVASGQKQLLDGELRLEGRARDFVRPPGPEGPPWSASTRVRLTDFPLETVGLFSDFQVKGTASGELTVDDVHENARASVQIALRDLELGLAKFPRGSARADFDGERLRAAMRLDQTDGPMSGRSGAPPAGGFIQTEAEVGMSWGRATAPKTTTDVPAFATLRASRFRAAALLPFLSGALSELDGRIDADARIDVKQGGGPPNMKGTVALNDGLVQLTKLGEPLHGVNVKVVVTPDGLVRVDDFTAHGSSGTLVAKAAARLNGLDLVGARANLHIPRRDPLPVDIDGQDIGDVDGDMSVQVDRKDGRETTVAVDIPRLHTLLPLSSSHKVQELGEAKGVRVGYFRRQRQFILLPKDANDLAEPEEAPAEASPSTTKIAVHLGNDVEIRRGTTLKVLLEGDPKIEITDRARMSGQIRLKRGTLEVQGKRFEIERGTVSFVGDEPANPQVMITAGWTAPDGTRVYADFQGPLKTGKVKLRSEPPRPQNEVLALIMFGTAEGSSSTPYATPQPTDSSTRAGVVAGGFVTEGLSKGLDELTGLEVSTKIDTTNSANPKPEVEVQIARDISLQLGYVLGTLPPGQNPDKTLVTLDWRFKRNWSMQTTFGDQGSSIVDFVWRYRY